MAQASRRTAPPPTMSPAGSPPAAVRTSGTATTELVRTLRDGAAPIAAAAGLDVHVTGSAATNIDVTDLLGARMPVLFAIVFGLSMDYEVFMLSRIREEYDRTGDASSSVADGLASTARVISAAAGIMVVVFGSFVFEEIREIKLFGLGLALAVLLDATLVRMVLVPATMALLGHRNWWMPRWLDRLVPQFAIEPTDRPAPVPTTEMEPA